MREGVDGIRAGLSAWLCWSHCLVQRNRGWSPAYLLITLLGLCRFRILRELTLAEGGYRQVEVDYHFFHADMAKEPVGVPVVDRKRLLACLRPDCALHHITLNWKVLDSLSDPALITAVAMLCPFETREKQALLEVYTV